MLGFYLFSVILLLRLAPALYSFVYLLLLYSPEDVGKWANYTTDNGEDLEHLYSPEIYYIFPFNTTKLKDFSSIAIIVFS